MSKAISLEAKIGQLFMFGFAGTELTPFIQRQITENNLGGVILFSRNIRSPEQVARLNHKLQELTEGAPSQAGLFISADQEGGTIARLTKGVVVAPSAMALGATDSETMTENVCDISGLELRTVGINMNLAPVVDVNNNPQNPVIGVRSFGENPTRVAKLGAAAIRGYQRHLMAVAKHFPGHGDTTLDSHHELPTISHDRMRLDNVELIPFKEAIASDVGAIMTSHVAFPAIEPREGLPATLSYQVLTKLLRKDLGFDGLVMTDCMEMLAIQNTFGTVEAAVMTIEAGADLVIISHREELQRQAFDALLGAVRSGRISEERIDESFQRIMKAKARFNLLQKTKATFDLSSLGAVEHVEVMQEAIQSSLTLVQDHKENLPLGNEKVFVVEFQGSAATQAEDVLLDLGTLAGALKHHGLENMGHITISMGVSLDEQQQVLAKAQEYDKVIVATADAHLNKGQGALVQELLNRKKNIIAVGTRTPYELKVFPEIPTYLAAFGNRPLVWGEVAQVLLGRSKALGTLPVTIPEII